MKLSDVPKHITEIPGHPPYFWTAYKAAYGEWPKEEEITPLWHLSYYDGPLSGIVVCRGRNFYVKHVYEEDRMWWAAWDLTPDEWARESARHKLFEEHVGTHTNYSENADGEWTRKIGTTKPQSEWDNFYKNPNIPKIDYAAEVEIRDMFAILRNPFRSW